MNVVLILLLISQAILILTKHRSNTLSCGIIAFNPSDTKKRVQWDKIKILLLANEVRGKNSTGLLTKSGSTRKLGTASSLLKDLVIKHSHNSFVLGQTRAPSIGMDRTIDAAQPIILKDDNEAEVFGLVHNGTIHNMDTLAIEYDVDVEAGETDSQTLARILEMRHYDVLEKYYGAASLIWWYREEPNKLYIFRGESSKTSYNTTYTSEERPLFIGKNRDGHYVSSIKEPIQHIFNTDEERTSIVEVPKNQIIMIENGAQSVLMNIDRESRHQAAPTVPAKKNKYNNNSGGRNYNAAYGYDDYEDYDYYKSKNGTEIPFKTDYEIMVEAYGEIETKTMFNWIEVPTIAMKSSSLYEEVLDKSKISDDDVFYYRGRYRVKTHVLNGVIHIKDNKRVNYSAMGSKKYGFINGVLLKNSDDFVKHYQGLRSLIFGTPAFYDKIKAVAAQPIPVVERVGEELLLETIKYDGQEFTGFYKSFFKERGIIECYGGFLGASVLHPLSSLKIKDVVYWYKDKHLVYGVVTKLLYPTNMVQVAKEGVKAEFTIDPTVIQSVVTVTEEQEKTAVNKKRILADIGTILKEALEEIELGEDAAVKSKVDLPHSFSQVKHYLSKTLLTLKD